MPSPVGHALAGIAVHVLVARDAEERVSWRRALVAVGAAVAPDLDLLGGFVGRPDRHQHEMHSVGFAILCGILAWSLGRAVGASRPARLGLAAGLAWASHVLLDFLAVDTSPPVGLMALWPFVPGYFHSPWSLFMDIGRTLEWATVRHDAVAMAWEVAVLTPLLALAWAWRAGRD